ncbi:SIMPL domain-containing protein [Tundrisphaera lichenicola]|uniref:SIMPL domain-containing protein n=1 Tax=Tundrisphaera lichenicola TaxID=2029860 RepID=UPI003EC0A7C6
MNKSMAGAIVLGLATLVAPGVSRAQFFGQMGAPSSGENIQGFTVAGKGAVAARPNSVEFDLEVSASSELTADAIVKYRDARKKLQDAFAGLKLANVHLDERGLLVDQKGAVQNPYFFGGMQPNSRAKTEVQLSRKLVARATDIREMDEEKVLQQVSRLLDVAQDAGARIGTQQDPYFYYRNGYPQNTGGLVRFVLDDFDKLEQEAYEKAIADARARAERLARLSRVELGPVVAIREIVVPGERGANADGELPRKRLEAAKFQEIPIQVELLVRFEVHPRPEGKGQAGQ